VDGRTVLRIDADFARAWSQVGSALDRTGFTVEERDRAAGFYRVRYVTPRTDKDEPGIFARIVGLGRTPATPAPLRFRIMVRGEGDATVVSVLDAAGAADAGDDAKRIVAVLADDLR
jgi:outer membrane protein assembly factor BamC